jgi:arsenate reductase
VQHRLHLGFEDPSNATGTPEFIHSEYVRIRDQIHNVFLRFFNEVIQDRG